jgi:hypothetical protein
MDHFEFNELIQQSLVYIENKQKELVESYDLDNFSRVEYEQETGTMIFSEEGNQQKVVAHFQVIGTYSDVSKTWLWAWDNPYLLNNTTGASLKLKEFGEQNNIQKLKDPKWKATRQDAWEMTALAAQILQAKGVQIIPSDEITAYVVLTTVKSEE